MRIDFWRDEGLSLRAIARKLKRAPSTLSRELARNTQSNGLYCPRAAQASRDARRQAGRPDPKLAPDSIDFSKYRRAAALSRRARSRKSMVLPSLSTAR
ncbi:helix-turn-helix domain-containing protein [Burkholderia ubonensis]|nr:helix-turn-helix domain-containing protein [Burkholderia ubonensis]